MECSVRNMSIQDNLDRFYSKKWGIFNHFLGGNNAEAWNRRVDGVNKETVSLKTCERGSVQGKDGRPAPIGSVYTGLFSTPRACVGEECGQLYVLWGKSDEEDLSHYKLYRGEIPGFVADVASFVANIQPSDKFCVERYTDSGLKHHTCYYYRVSAVSRAGIEGPLSEECSAYTQEDENNL